MDELYGADVHAAGRLGGDDYVGVAGELACQDGLLLVAPERNAPGVRVRGPDVVGPEVLRGAPSRMTFGKIQPNRELGGSS